jgi:F-type H+-transporting ATPase subunit b
LSLLAFSDSAIQLVPDGTLLFHLALIVVMVALLNVTLLKPINRILEERERRTKGRIGEAQRILTSLDERALEYQRRLREARGTGYLLLEEERTTASRNREELVSAVKAEVMRWQEQEKENLKKAEADVKVSLIKDAGVRAAEIGSRILGRPIRTEKR